MEVDLPAACLARIMDAASSLALDSSEPDIYNTSAAGLCHIPDCPLAERAYLITALQLSLLLEILLAGLVALVATSHLAWGCVLRKRGGRSFGAKFRGVEVGL